METYRQAVERAKREYLTAVMRDCGFVVARSAVVAGCNRTEFYRLLDQHAPELRAQIAPRPPPWHLMGRATAGNAAWKSLDPPELRA